MPGSALARNMQESLQGNQLFQVLSGKMFHGRIWSKASCGFKPPICVPHVVLSKGGECADDIDNAWEVQDVLGRQELHACSLAIGAAQVIAAET